MTHYLSPWRDPVLTLRHRWQCLACHWQSILVRLLIMPVITTTSSLFARKRSKKEALIKSGLSPFSQLNKYIYIYESTILHRARLLKATFLVLTKQLKPGLEELTAVVEEAGEDKKALVNALVKRGSLYIQRCHEPNEVMIDSSFAQIKTPISQDADLSYKDFNRALEADPNSADVLMNRGCFHYGAPSNTGNHSQVRFPFCWTGSQRPSLTWLRQQSSGQTLPSPQCR